MRCSSGILLLGLAVLVLLSGCAPRTVVIPNPGPKTRGIRYYRPKPYLLITPFTHVESEENAGRTVPTNVEPSDQYVTIQLEMLPDFSEEYAIQVRTGTGSATVNIQLEDGWNLTQIDQTLDSQFDENISALADLIGAVAPSGLIPAPDAPGAQAVNEVKAVVRATNVPIGYYEAVIGRDPNGRKQMFGWRYLGFVPYAPCPQLPVGADCQDCHLMDLYGLVFDNGVMTFKRLSTIQAIGQEGAYVRARAVQTREDEQRQGMHPDQPHVRPHRLPAIGPWPPSGVE